MAAVCIALFACGCARQTLRDMPITITPKAEQPSPALTSIPEASPVGRFTPPPEMQECTVACDDAVNLRDGASSHAELIGTVEEGARVRVIEFQERYAYVEVLASGQKGYMVAGYLQPETDVLGLDVVSITDAYSYDQMREDMRALTEIYGETIKIVIAGESANGLELPVMVLGNPQAPHHVFVQAAIHAREHMTALLAMALSEAWLKAGASQEVCFHVMPMANPDGIQISQGLVYDAHIQQIQASDAAAAGEQPDEAEYLREWKANYNGVDLNRNFDALWEKVEASTSPSSEGYRGTAPESEPETQALVSYTKSRDFDATISYHATGSMIYWQFGDATQADRAAYALAKVIGELSGYSIEPDDGTSFGGYKDWASSKCGIPSLTIEIGTRSAPLPETDFYNIWMRNRFVFRTVAEWVKNA